LYAGGGSSSTSGSTFPYTGSAQITGSLSVTGSTTSDTFNGLYVSAQVYTGNGFIPNYSNAFLIGPTSSIAGTISVGIGSNFSIIEP